MQDRNMVVTVNEQDQETGIMEKMEAHRQGILHRAFSIFILNEKGELLLQQRAPGKYHSPGLWTNTCCSHPMPGEAIADAADRRLKEEMGFSCPLSPAFSFIYRSDVGNGLIEHELDHVFLGTYEGSIEPDPSEVMDWKYITLDELSEKISKDEASFTAWLKIVYPRFREYIGARG